MTQYQQLVEYHAAIILYNFGIIHQCLGMTDDHDDPANDPATMDSEESPKYACRTNSIGSAGVVTVSTTSTDADRTPMTLESDSNDHHTNDNEPNDDRHNPTAEDLSSQRLMASYKILSNTLSWIHELVRPVMEDVMNESNEDLNMEIYATSVATTTPNDQYYMNKYLQVMVLINYHILDIIHTLHFPDGPYMYHCTMMNEILNFISYLEIFYPMTSNNNNNHSNNSNNSNIGNGNSRGSASPAA
jgi:hypothetical protein